jgi:squalene synthase HpnD
VSADTDMQGDLAVWAHVDRIVRSSKSSFYWAMRLLPAPKRVAMFAIYAYCRELDDIADTPAPIDEKRRKLAAWRREVNDVFQARPATDIGRALEQVRLAYPIERDDLLAVIDGVATDAEGPVVRPSQAEFDAYCDRVAAAVGRLSVAIFGASGPAGQELAENLGRALQITNILRDLAEDRDVGRLYLPDEVLSSAGIASRTPGEVLADPRLPKACAELAAKARGHFDRAADALARCDRRSVRPAAVMMVSYRRLLKRLERRGWPIKGPKVRLTRGEKLVIGIRYGLL